MALTGIFDERELTNRLKRGDVAAFDAVYWQYHEAVYRNILRLTKDSEVAADLLQDVFVRLWEKRNRLKRGKPLGGWLFVISYHLAINYNKHTMRELVAKDELAAQGCDADDTRSIEWQHQLLTQAVSTLTAQKQRIFTRCKLAGKSYEEVAQELGISKHTVKEHLSIAMKTVKAYIQRHATALAATGLGAFLSQGGQ